MTSISCRKEILFIFCPSLWDVIRCCIPAWILEWVEGRGLQTAALQIQSLVCLIGVSSSGQVGLRVGGYSKIEGKGSAPADPAQPSSSMMSWGLCCFRWLTGSHGLIAEAEAHVSIQWGCSSFVSSYLCLLVLWKHLCGSWLLWTLIKGKDLSLNIQGL